MKNYIECEKPANVMEEHDSLTEHDSLVIYFGSYYFYSEMEKPVLCR
jgi:hypothetical protein